MDLAQRKVHQRSSSCTRAVPGTAYHSSCSPRRAGEGEEGQSRAVAREMLMRTLFSGRWSMALRIWVCCWASALLWVYRALICKVGREARVWCGRDGSRRRCSKGIAASSCFLALSLSRQWFACVWHCVNEEVYIIRHGRTNRTENQESSTPRHSLRRSQVEDYARLQPQGSAHDDISPCSAWREDDGTHLLLELLTTDISKFLIVRFHLDAPQQRPLPEDLTLLQSKRSTVVVHGRLGR